MADEDEELSKISKTRDLPFEEINFISILSQTNVYGLTKFYEKKSECSMLLLASLKGQILSIGSLHSSRPSSLSSSIVPFRDIQGWSETIDCFYKSSIDCFSKCFMNCFHT